LTSAFRVDLRPSPTLAALAFAGRLAAVACLWLVLAPPAAALATAGLALSLAGFLRMRRRQPLALVVGPGVQLQVVDRTGESRAASVRFARVPVWWLAILGVSVQSGGQETRCLLADTTDAESLRRLRGRVLAQSRRGRDDAPRAKEPKATKDPGPA
jgi:hypothetical protein